MEIHLSKNHGSNITVLHALFNVENIYIRSLWLSYNIFSLKPLVPCHYQSTVFEISECTSQGFFNAKINRHAQGPGLYFRVLLSA